MSGERSSAGMSVGRRLVRGAVGFDARRQGRSGEQSLAGTSIPRHLVRGAMGFGALIGSVVLLPLTGPASLLLAPLGLVVLRGCPTCWVIGLARTMSRGRLERSCVDGRCELKGPRPPAS
jgi:hypothetical protein